MPVLNEGDGIYDSILALDEQTHPIERLHIIDGGSDDDTLDEIERAEAEVPFDVTVTVEPGAGVRASSQTGAGDIAEWLVDEYGDGVVLRCEGDSSLEDNFVEEAVDALSEPENTVFGAPVAPHEPGEDRIKKTMFQVLQNADRLPKGRGMAFRAKDFLEVDGYRISPDEELENAYIDCLEDGIITTKLNERGDIVFCEDTTVYSSLPSTTATSLERWKKAVVLETKIGPSNYFTRLGNPLWVARYTGRSVTRRLNLDIVPSRSKQDV